MLVKIIHLTSVNQEPNVLTKSLRLSVDAQDTMKNTVQLVSAETIVCSLNKF